VNARREVVSLEHAVRAVAGIGACRDASPGQPVYGDFDLVVLDPGGVVGS